MANRIITKFSYWTGIPLIFCIIMIIIPFVGNVVQDSNYYFSYNKYLIKRVKIDSLVIINDDAGAATLWAITSLDKRKIVVGHGHINWSYNLMEDSIESQYKRQNEYLDIWYNKNSDDAYFVEPGLEEMNFRTVWLPDLKRLSIVLAIYLFHLYCQRVRKQYEQENPDNNETS